MLMTVKLFLLGRPGCGKSRTAKHVEAFIRNNGWDWITSNFKDYDILHEMAENDILHEEIYLHEDGTFDVKKASKLDEAIHILESRINEHFPNIDIHQSGNNQFIIIELARGNYDDAFTQFLPVFLQNAYFLLIDADFDECKKRIKQRITSSDPDNRDNHDISNFVMETYYRNQYPLTMEHLLPRFQMLNNNGEWEDFTKELEPFIRQILNIPDADR